MKARSKVYQLLGRDERSGLSTSALYNAGNLQLREALKEESGTSVRALPLIELAKQSYRGALRRDPHSWDARYNLERRYGSRRRLKKRQAIVSGVTPNRAS